MEVDIYLNFRCGIAGDPTVTKLDFGSRGRIFNAKHFTVQVLLSIKHI